MASTTTPVVKSVAGPAGGTNEPESTGVMQWLLRTVPTAAVLALIVGLAFWGNATEWSIPKFSALFGGKAEEAADWCEAHNVPESQCVECNPTLCPIGMD